MNVSAILEELECLGVELCIVGNDLEYEGPEEAITSELLERLKAHKEDLMRVCRKTDTVSEEDRNPAEDGCMRNTTDYETCKLSAARWEPKKRCGKTIWKYPGSGFYYSQVVALHLLSQQEHSEQERGKRKEVTQRGGGT
jgi:hypothetical protein